MNQLFQERRKPPREPGVDKADTTARAEGTDKAKQSTAPPWRGGNLYSEKVMDHFINPRNMGEMANPDGEATVGNPVCGDVMKFYIKVGLRDKKEFLEDVQFQTLGCGAAIATSSIATEMLKGKALEEADKLTNQAVAEALGGLPAVKMHCSILAEEGIKKAIADYRRKQKETRS